MARRDGCDVVYWAAQRWVDAALRKDDSLFTPGHSIWSLDNLDDFHQRVVGQPNAPGSGFFEKFESQLAEAPPETIQLAAEILYVHYLIASPDAIGGKKKRERIRQVIGWSTLDLSIPSDHDKALDVGILHPGACVGPDKPAHVQLIAEFVQHWKRRPAQRHSSVLDSPWVFKEEVQAIKVPKAGVQAEALLHLAHPDTFEPIVSSSQKRRIRDAFSTLLNTLTGDIDRDLLAIRQRLNGQADCYKEGFDFYSADVKFTWSPDASAWDRFIGWGRRFVEHDVFEKDDRPHKETIANNVQSAKFELEAGNSDWLKALNRAFDLPNNLTRFDEHGAFISWCENNHTEATNALSDFWIKPGDVTESVRVLLDRVPPDSLKDKRTRVKIAAFLAMAIDPHAYPPYHDSTFQAGYKLTGFHSPHPQESESSVYRHALNFLELVMKKARKRKLKLRDRLDAQSMLQAVVKWGPGFLPVVERGAFQQYLNNDKPTPLKLEEPIPDQTYTQHLAIMPLRLPAASDGGGTLTYALTPEPPVGLTLDPMARTLSGRPTRPQPATAYTYAVRDQDGASAEQTFSISVATETLEELAARLFWGAGHLRNIQRLLEDKRQVVFYGPPGTGKTYVALELARHFAGDGDSTSLVQFHPSYAYEDFVEGYRPADKDGQPGFDLKPGPLKRIAETARDNPGATHVLVIDEINRGNVARVFGELYFLLEYRDHEMSLQYSDDPFTLPKNLWFIATMNTADRSIALVDAALRRRFRFVEFSPHEPPIKGLLREWLSRHKPDSLWVADLVDLANSKLPDRHLAIGPSYFMHDQLDEEWVELIWKHSIIPYIEEQLFGDDALLAEFELATLRAEIKSADASANGDGNATSPAS